MPAMSIETPFALIPRPEFSAKTASLAMSRRVIAIGLNRKVLISMVRSPACSASRYPTEDLQRRSSALHRPCATIAPMSTVHTTEHAKSASHRC